MFSKYVHFASGSPVPFADATANVNTASLKHFYGNAFCDPVRVKGGTLSVAFLAEVEGRRRFFKTYAFERDRARLQIELRIMQILYRSRLQVERLELPDVEGRRLWIAMDALSAVPHAISLEQIVSLTEDCNLKFVASPMPETMPALDDFSQLIDAGAKALVELKEAQILSLDIACRTNAALEMVCGIVPTLPRCMCHGDLGPRNIMEDAKGLIVVDWEDAFIGFHGYDRLYWLTFFQNRNFLTRESLGFTKLGLNVEIAILALIVLLKCWLAFVSGSYLGHSLNFNSRLREVFAVVE